MFLDNDTKSVEKMISHESMKVHFGQNLIVFLSIFLTAVMLTGVISTGFSFYNAEKIYSDLSPGPGADGFAIMGMEEHEKKIKQYSDVKWASLVKDASYQRLENPQTINCDVELLVADQVFYKNNYIVLQSGNFPKKATDILISDTLAQKLTLENPVGQQIQFTVRVRENGQEVKKPINFVVSGFYKNPLSHIAAEYEEIYTSSEFINTFNQEILNKPGHIYIKLNKISDKNAIYERLNQINEEVKGLGVIYKMKETDSKETIITTILAILIIMVAAYFIIFNIFSISLANDIRYYGMMKTIGATTKQIRATLNRQVYILLPFALILGLLAGNGCGRIIAPKMVGLMDGLKNFYEPAPIILPSCLVALFVFITVKISCLQSFRKVSKISPIEAARFVAPQKMNMIFASISLILSCIIFSSIFTFFFGYNVTKQVNKRNIYDFKLMNNLYLLGSSDEPFEPISNELCTQLEKLPFVDNMEIVYAAHSQPDSYEEIFGNSYYLRARVKNTGLLKKDFKRAQSEKLTYSFDITDNDLRVPICGVSSKTIKQTLKNKKFTIIDGTIEPKKFESGDYVIYQPFGFSTNHLAVHAGDDMDIEVFDSSTKQYKSKKLKVMAVVTNNDRYGSSQFSEIGICLLDKTFKEIYPDYNQMIVSVALDSNNPTNFSTQQKEIETLMRKYSSYQITFFSKYNSTLYFKNERDTLFFIGLFFAVFFSIIGIANMANHIANNILSNKISYTRMQAVGMTQKQLIKTLTFKNLKVYGLAIFAFIPLEFVILIKMFTGFSIKMFIVSVFLVIVAVITILLFISYILAKYLNKKTIAQRLREIE